MFQHILLFTVIFVLLSLITKRCRHSENLHFLMLLISKTVSTNRYQTLRSILKRNAKIQTESRNNILNTIRVYLVIVFPGGTLPYLKLRYVRLLRTPLQLSPHPKTPLNSALSHKYPIFYKFLIKNYKFVIVLFLFLFFVFVFVLITSMVKKYEILHKFPSKFVTKHILF